MWTADQAYYLTADGRAVSAGSPAGVRLLVAQGGQLPIALAAQYDLPGAKALLYPPANKMRRGPLASKGGPTKDRR